MVSSSLFSPLRIGQHTLKHRVVLAPLTRNRANQQGEPTDLMLTYYQQRATEGGLLISEATGISPTSGHYPNTPGIYTQKQIEDWKKITKGVHEKGSIFFLQLWHLGRTSFSMLLPDQQRTVSASEIPINGASPLGIPYETPRALTKDEIKSIIQDYATAAKNAILAGFDGIEIHGSSGYLPDQFLNSSSNQRTDEYGGSIENRSRFVLELVDKVTKAIGEEKTAIRLSPYNEFQDMFEKDRIGTWSYVTEQLQKNHPNLAYLHFVEPRIRDFDDQLPAANGKEEIETLDHFKKIWQGPFIAGGNYTYDYNLAYENAEKSPNTLYSFGRSFIANPDLVERIRNQWPLNKYDRATFYSSEEPKGYIDYPFYETSKQ
ncbi:hypothetical protein BJ944DRAFT_231820 [Cunninghamella echinulata]|nr:hypothetical protein BJ944DRAFT_231820 [Cunninghamella echinulata]